MLIVSAVQPGRPGILVAAVPSARKGIRVIPDWDNIGQRQTDSGSVAFEKLRVEQHEILDDPGPLSTPFSCLRPLIAQLSLTHVYLGIAEGAFAEARHYTLRGPPWHRAGVARTDQDPTSSNATASSGSASKACAPWPPAPPTSSTPPGPRAAR
jgi:alkylation response protein AidB-like acyl-CoA dehydrogenase